MADSSLPVNNSTIEQARNHRHDDYESWDNFLQRLMDRTPSIHDMYEDGCINCGETIPADFTPEMWGGVVEWFEHETDAQVHRIANYYCSRECAAEHDQKIQQTFPEHPDEVIVGGKDALRTGIEGATFHMNEDGMDVSLDVPGAFAGTDESGNEYDYTGEPVYIYHEGDYRQRGVIEDIIHEETFTVLLLGRDYDVTGAYHPDDDKRAEYHREHGDGGGEA